MSSIDLWILLWSPQSLARELSRIVLRGKVDSFGMVIDTICAASLAVAVIVLLVFLGLWNQDFGLVVGIPADPVKEGQSRFAQKH